MADLDWSKCDLIESVVGVRSGAWVYKNTRMPVSTVFSNLAAGASIEEIMEWFDVTREQIVGVLDFAALTLDASEESILASREKAAHEHEKLTQDHALAHSV